MTTSVTTNKFNANKIVWPAHTLISNHVLKQTIIEFLDNNPEGVRNCDVVCDWIQRLSSVVQFWTSESLVKEEKVEKRSINGKTLYFSVG